MVFKVRSKAGLRGSISLALLALVLGCTASGETGEDAGVDGGRPKPVGRPVAPPPSCTVGTAVSLSEGLSDEPAIAFAGNRYVVVFRDVARDGGLYSEAFDEHGAKEAEFPIASGTEKPAHPAITALPSGGFAVAWESQASAEPRIRARFIDADGRAREPAFDAVSAGAHPSLAPSGTGAALAWTEQRHLFVGSLLDHQIVNAEPLGSGIAPGLTAAASGVGAIWEEAGQLGFSMLEGTLHAANRVTLGETQGKPVAPRIAHGTDTYPVVWEDDQAGEGNETVHFVRIGRDRKPGPIATVSEGLGSANAPDVATLKDDAAVVYYQFRDGPPRVYLTFITKGESQPSGDFLISGKRPAKLPRIAAGTNTLGIAFVERNGPVRLSVVRCEPHKGNP